MQENKNMNPYVYSKKGSHRASAKWTQSPSVLSLVKSLGSAGVSSVLALAIIILAAGSSASIISLASADTGFADTASLNHIAAHKQYRVLGDSTTATVRVGQLVYNTTGNKTIYLVGSNGLYGFTTAEIFYSWGYKFGDVVPINGAEAALAMVGTVPKKSPACANVLDQINGKCGDSSALLTVPDASQAARTGQLVYNPGDRTIYLVGSNILYPFDKAETFYSWGFTFSQVVKANPSELALQISQTFVPVRSSACSSALDQIANKCGNTTTAQNTAPDFTLPVFPSNGSFININTEYGFNFNAIDAQGGVLSAKVGWGDNTTNTGSISVLPNTLTQYSRFSHTYTQPGSYLITVTVTDSQGLSTTKSGGITVVNSSAGFTVSPPYLSFTAAATATALDQQTVSINPGSSTAGWTAQVQSATIPGLNLYYNGSVGGIVTGNGSATIKVGIVGPFTAGSFSSSINIISGGQTKTLPVYLIVAAQAASAKVTQTASLTVNGRQNAGGEPISVNVGDTLNYQWSSANAVSADSYLSVSPADTCGHNSVSVLYPWVAYTASGSNSTKVLPCQAGSTYIITYRVYNQNATQVYAISTLVIKVNPVSGGSDAKSVNLQINKTAFASTESWALDVNSNIPGGLVTLCGAKAPALPSSTCTPAGNLGYQSTTNSSGSWSASGKFSSGDTGTWYEYVTVGGVASNAISFTIY